MGLWRFSAHSPNPSTSLRAKKGIHDWSSRGGFELLGSTGYLVLLQMSLAVSSLAW
jgi:hypothetical protein